MGLTQKSLSEKTGIPLQSIINYESGKRSPNAKAMVTLERFFGVSGEFLSGELKKDILNSNYKDILDDLCNLKFNSEVDIGLSEHLKILSLHLMY